MEGARRAKRPPDADVAATAALGAVPSTGALHCGQVIGPSPALISFQVVPHLEQVRSVGSIGWPPGGGWIIACAAAECQCRP